MSYWLPCCGGYPDHLPNFFLEEAMEPLQLVGGVLVIASVILLQLKPQMDPGLPGKDQ